MCVCVCACVYIHACMYVCMYVCVFVYKHIDHYFLPLTTWMPRLSYTYPAQ